MFDQDLSDRTISIYALKTIQPDDEIVMNYNQRTGDTRKWHFERPRPTGPDPDAAAAASSPSPPVATAAASSSD